MGPNKGIGTWLPYSVALLLTGTAGFVDAVGFLHFAHVYTANMSGNSVALGIALGQRNPAQALFRLWPVFIYTAGLVLGRLIIAAGASCRLKRIASVSLGIEAILLGAAILLVHRSAGRTWEIALLASAMGIQNATLVQFSSLTVHTGFVTGALLKFAEESVGFVAWLGLQLRQGTRLTVIAARAVRERSFRASVFLFLVWSAYVAGAVLGAWRQSVTGINCLTIAIAVLALLIFVDLLNPLAQKEEQQQASLSR